MAGKKTLTEWKGANALEKILIGTNHVLPFVFKADKRVSSDGLLEVYNNIDGLETKANMFGKIPVQIKSENHALSNKNTIRRQINYYDLLNYRNEGGCMYFIIYVADNDQTQIFYNALSPADINQKLSTSNQKPCQFTFKLFPEDINDIILLLRSFYTDCQKQTRDEKSIYIHEKLNDEQISEISSFELISHGTNKNPFASLLNGPTTIYAKTKLGLVHPYAKVWGVEISKDDKDEVWFNNKKYYDSVRHVKIKDGNLIKIGKGIEISEEINLKFNSSGTLSERICDLYFILDICKNPDLRVTTTSGIEFGDFNIGNDSTIQELENELRYLLEIQDTLKHFGVNSDLNNDLMQDIDFTNMNNLIDIKNGARFEAHPYPNMFFDILDMPIANLRIALHIKKEDCGYIYEDFFKMAEKSDVRISGDGVESEASRFILLSKECFARYDNADFTLIANSITSKKYAPLYADKVWELLQKALTAYDEHINRCDILDFALAISKWLVDNESIPMFTLDYLQTIKRKCNKISDDEIRLLLSIKNQPDVPPGNVLVACILLESNLEAMNIWSSLPKKQQEVIATMPIFRLWNPQHLA